MKRKLPEVDPVVLHDIAGMRAGKVIFISLVIIILLLFFLIFMLPGIIKGGRYIHFSSTLTEVGVYVDDKYIGSTEGSRYFISSGEHKVTYIKDGSVLKEDTIKISHPIFFTLLIHYKADIDVDIKGDSTIFERSYNRRLQEAVLYSAITDYDEYYNYKPIFTYLAKDAISCGINDVSNQFKTLVAFVNSNEMKADLDNAIAILNENNIIYNSSDFDKLYALLDSYLAANSEINTTIANAVVIPTANGSFYTYPSTEFTIGKNGSLSSQDAPSLPLTLTVPSFSISGNMVSEYEYALFVEANPYWAKSNRETLIEDGVVDEYYLEGIYLTTSTRSEKPIRNISYYAAKAYIDYLNSKDSTYSYRLPTEAEFEVMASSTKDKAYSTSLITVDNDTSMPTSVMGGLWEFTDSHFVPLARLSDNYSSLTKLDEADIIIKGGSYINDPSTISAASTGIIEKNTDSEYTGFRVVREVK